MVCRMNDAQSGKINESYLSWPAVSHISNLTVVESCRAIVCDKKEAPTVTLHYKV
jgi:hypothetical protein